MYLLSLVLFQLDSKRRAMESFILERQYDYVIDKVNYLQLGI
jgi:hypothetical protein